MANLSIRKLDEETMAKLRFSAKNHNVSMEEEVRQILKKNFTTPEHLGDVAVELFSPTYGKTDPLQIPDRSRHEPLNFSE